MCACQSQAPAPCWPFLTLLYLQAALIHFNCTNKTCWQPEQAGIRTSLLQHPESCSSDVQKLSVGKK